MRALPARLLVFIVAMTIGIAGLGGATVTAQDIHARAYAYVKKDGTLWAPMTRNITTVAHPSTGLYCVSLSFDASAAVATIDAASFPVATPPVIYTFLPHGPQGGAYLTGCPQGFHGVSVLIERASNGVRMDASFWIVLY